MFAPAPRAILIRHSTPRIVPGRSADRWSLSAEGRRRARDLAAELAPIGLGAVYTSPEPKARQTATIVAEPLDLPVVEVADLREHARETVPVFASEAEFRRRAKALFDHPDRRVFGEESAAEALERFAAAVEAILEGVHERLAVVTHGTVMSLYLARRSGRSAWEIWNALTTPCVVELGADGAPVEASMAALLG